MMKMDLTGQVYGHLTVISFAGISNCRKRRWHCRCACGNEVIAIVGNLRNGHTASCGCSRRNQRRRAGEGQTSNER